MELAKPQVDVGLFTNQLEAMQAFYGEKIGLQFESVLPVGGGFRQYRYLCNGSVIKLMHSRELLRPRRPGGYETLMIATPKATGAEAETAKSRRCGAAITCGAAPCTLNTTGACIRAARAMLWMAIRRATCGRNLSRKSSIRSRCGNCGGCTRKAAGPRWICARGARLRFRIRRWPRRVCW